MPENKPIEAIKTSYRQIKEGMQLTLVIHPDDMPDWLVLAPLGQRMSFAAVPIRDEESEHGQGEKVHRSWDELTPVQQAGIRCADRTFQHWVQRQPMLEQICWDFTPEQHAAEWVRQQLGVKSRSELVPGSDAAAVWADIDRRYREETRLAEQR